MLSLLKKLFGVKPAEQTVEVPYKVEVAPTVEAANQTPYKAPKPVVVETPVVAAVKQQPKKRPARRKPAGPKTVQQPAQKPAAAKQNVAKQSAPKKPKSKA